MKVTTVSIGVIVLVLAFVAFRFLVTETVPTAHTGIVDTLPAQTRAQNKAPQTALPGGNGDDIEPGAACIPSTQIQAHPLVQRIQQGRQSVVTNGIDVENFRGLDEETIRGFAEQGDTAAMAALGAAAVMRAYRIDSRRAVEWLANGGTMEGVVMQRQQLSADASLALNDAAYWFYEAALHGRVAALTHYGQVRDQLFGGPVGLGWFEPEAFAGLPSTAREAMQPATLYGAVADRLWPTEPLQAKAGDAMEAVEQVLQAIETEFVAALDSAELPLAGLDVSQRAELQSLLAQQCP